MASSHSFWSQPISTLSFRTVLDKQERGLHIVVLQFEGKENSISEFFSWDLGNPEREMGKFQNYLSSSHLWW